jgi:hypothetical protein
MRRGRVPIPSEQRKAALGKSGDFGHSRPGSGFHGPNKESKCCVYEKVWILGAEGERRAGDVAERNYVLC